jgi:membrane-associated phospholipid phosphatase
MHFLKRNRYLVPVALLIIPAFFVDRAVLSYVENFYATHAAVFHLVRAVEPFVNFISNGATLIGAAFLLFLGGKYYQRRFYLPGKRLFWGLITSGIVAQIIKHLLGRARPRITHDTIFIGPSLKGSYDSFPSGHTTVAFCLAYMLSWYYPKHKGAFYAFAVLVGIDRIQGFNHFPADVLGGVIVGTLVGEFFVDRDKKAPTPIPSAH